MVYLVLQIFEGVLKIGKKNDRHLKYTDLHLITTPAIQHEYTIRLQKYITSAQRSKIFSFEMLSLLTHSNELPLVKF